MQQSDSAVAGLGISQLQKRSEARFGFNNNNNNRRENRRIANPLKGAQLEPKRAAPLCTIDIIAKGCKKGTDRGQSQKNPDFGGKKARKNHKPKIISKTFLSRVLDVIALDAARMESI